MTMIPAFVLCGIGSCVAFRSFVYHFATMNTCYIMNDATILHDYIPAQ